MKITKERLLQIIKEEVERHRMLEVVGLLDDIFAAVRAAKKAGRPALRAYKMAGRDVRKINSLLRAGTVTVDQIPKYILKKYEESGGKIPKQIAPGGKPGAERYKTKFTGGKPGVVDKLKSVMPATKMGKAKRVAQFNLLMILGLEGVPDRVESYYRDIANKLSGKKVNWNTVGAAIEAYAGQLGMGVADLPELVSPTELLKNLEVLVRSPYTAGRKMIGGKESNRESAIAVVWPNYMVSDAGPVGHASVVLIKPNGNTMFLDVGRYCGGSKLAYFSRTSFTSVGKAKYDDSGKITNIDQILSRIKRKNRKAGSMEAVVVRGCDYDAAVNFVSAGSKPGSGSCQNNGYKRHFGPYSFKSRAGGTSCAVFAIQVLEAGGCSSIAASARSTLFVAPRKLVKLAQNDFDERTFSV